MSRRTTLPAALRPKASNKGNTILDYHALLNFTPKVRKGEAAISLKFRAEHCYTLNAMRWTENSQVQSAILSSIHLKRWAERTDSLWWSALSHMAVGKRTVRSWCARRLRNAFTESLWKEGFAPDGSTLPGSRRRQPMIGTAMLGATPPILKINNDALIEQTDAAVKHMIWVNSRDRWQKANGHEATDVHTKGVYKRGSQGRGPNPGVRTERAIFRYQSS
ncbi:uncharacterized protein LY89DRAFT_185625 [Mollisia scopiformis]|uniref:Uncharacterized protein n=1 Tax=Mollisia scopiformis TaxID=149040 RepID=A0A194XV12_MOLSC|nr:uncharacterized protein LY89DRAFT_185625 [Mollisia scopiformis]KUJ23547.1 hypothetical protein LY89DRAFT_185625 [Mollisia scopiformis]